ncbi:serine hydrolase [Sporosarcina sp. NCCP-2716]|uniref:serine hydrolase domain-containing protein n=1 Tax=Sporosarcina sp. NCCP-2716 TaxID=2943679 RepID=UPI00203DCC40|nr:serine hydrolase domain-containing protein [Sporosarcina sp. NCCP-2716]GKV70585.1 serine hydrolase [Sporosarcina sp. NCCP-2716]
MMNIEGIVNEHIESGFFTAAVCGVSVNGESVYKKAFGIRDSRLGEECNVDTMFDLASITKLFTSTLILKLISDNWLSLHSTLEECLPEAGDSGELRGITLHQLLTHSSGLLAWYPFYTKGDENFFDILGDIQLKSSADGETLYSDLNYMLLGKVIERTLGMSLDDAVERYFADQLRMPSVTYNPSGVENIAATEFGNRIEKSMCTARSLQFDGWRDESEPIVGEVNDGNSFYYFDSVAGHAGIFSDVDDLVALGSLYLSNTDEAFISSDVLDVSLRRQVGDRGLGWDFGEAFPEGFGHTGFTGTALWVVPERNLVVGLLTNRLHVSEPKNINPFRKTLFNEILKQL